MGGDRAAGILARNRVLVTGARGFLGTVVCRVLEARGCRQLLTPGRGEYDLTREDQVARLFAEQRPEVVIHLAAEVGGIGANMEQPGRFFYANMAMALHLIEQARIHEIDKFVYVGTVCSYPKYTPLPFRELDLWNGYPEETNAPYGIAKKAGLVMLEAYRSQYGLRSACVLPVNLYGPNESFDLASSHVIPALIRKCVEAQQRGERSIECWGTGRASREFLYVDDAAEGVVRAAESIEDPHPINLGSGREIEIRELAKLVAERVGYTGELRWNEDRPDGQPRRCLDLQRAKALLGWEARVGLEEGLDRTIQWYRSSLGRSAA